ncbi:hypothetical protein PR048_009009 [Dryococelus australis]|uniref:Uncharacterized protein n=1 Tax=Dryococelus australis TaxID=614101 RepID=A0ABQ9HZR2_9NEOP|nr:hypothetical protein PR048_009009 [Dryococelus australis]
MRRGEECDWSILEGRVRVGRGLIVCIRNHLLTNLVGFSIEQENHLAAYGLDFDKNPPEKHIDNCSILDDSFNDIAYKRYDWFRLHVAQNTNDVAAGGIWHFRFLQPILDAIQNFHAVDVPVPNNLNAEQVIGANEGFYEEELQLMTKKQATEYLKNQAVDNTLMMNHLLGVEDLFLFEFLDGRILEWENIPAVGRGVHYRRISIFVYVIFGSFFLNSSMDGYLNGRTSLLLEEEYTIEESPSSSTNARYKNYMALRLALSVEIMLTMELVLDAITTPPIPHLHQHIHKHVSHRARHSQIDDVVRTMWGRRSEIGGKQGFVLLVPTASGGRY